MCVAFTGKAVFDYIFSSQERDGVFRCVSRDEVDSFCDNLASEITSHGRENPHYKYVYFDLDEQSLLEVFAQNQSRYLSAGDYIYGLVNMADDVDRINARYADSVIEHAMARAYAMTFSGPERTVA